MPLLIYHNSPNVAILADPAAKVQSSHEAIRVLSEFPLTCIWERQPIDICLTEVGKMRCPPCESTATKERREGTELGYRRFRRRTYQREFNERTGTRVSAERTEWLLRSSAVRAKNKEWNLSLFSVLTVLPRKFPLSGVSFRDLSSLKFCLIDTSSQQAWRL